MKKCFYLGILLFIFIGELNAQNGIQLKGNQPVKRTFFKDLHSFLGGAVSAEFKGAVICDDRLLAKGLQSISLFPVDTIQTITYIHPESVTKALTDIDPECQYGILIMNTSSSEPWMGQESVLLLNLEQIILNSKKILYKNESQEPD